MAAAPPLSFRDVLETALLRAVEASERRVWIHLPGSNAPAMALAVEHGLRITMPLVLMASRRFGDLNRYIPHSPGMM